MSENRSEQINEIATALSKTQGEIKNAKMDTINPHFKSKYADLASVWDSCREPLSKNGLSITQVFIFMDGTYLETTLMHTSGQWISSILPIQPVRNDPQGVGSAITYMRRYALSAIVGIAPEDDDDGNDSSRSLQKEEYNYRAPQGPTGKTVIPPKPMPQAEVSKHPTEPQLKRLFAIVHAHGLSNDEIKEMIKKDYKIESSKELTIEQYNELVGRLEAGLGKAEDWDPKI